jgi:nucleotide-binding universal stress UspA family protein
MKILIGYDGSGCSEAAIDDLKVAGLPDDARTHVMSIAEAWLPPPPEGADLKRYAQDLQTHPQPFRGWQTNAKQVTEACAKAEKAARMLRSMFPKWNITSEGGYGSPAWEILSKSREIDSDLIVVGSQGLSLISRIFLGSISQKVLTEADCSVRVARGKIDVDPSPARIIIGFDGSQGANFAVEVVGSRSWPAGSEVRVVSATEPVTPSIAGAFIPRVARLVDEINESEHEWLVNLAAPSLALLRSKGISADLRIHEGPPKRVLVEEAERWRADCIFVGANRFGSTLERILLGSTAAAVAARAHCSVEVVRQGKNINNGHQRSG